MTFQKAVYGKTPRQQLQHTQYYTTAGETSPVLEKLVNDIGQSYPLSGLAHFWSDPEMPVEEGGLATIDKVADGLTHQK